MVVLIVALQLELSKVARCNLCEVECAVVGPTGGLLIKRVVRAVQTALA